MNEICGSDKPTVIPSLQIPRPVETSSVAQALPVALASKLTVAGEHWASTSLCRSLVLGTALLPLVLTEP